MIHHALNFLAQELNGYLELKNGVSGEKVILTNVAKEGGIIRDMMFTSIAGDHRIVDGAHVAAFLNMIIDLIERPERMLLEAI